MSARLDDLLRDAAPIRDEDVRTLALEAEAQLREAIVAQPRGGADDGAPPRLPRGRRRALGLAVALAAVVAALALAGVSLDGGGDLRTAPERAWGQEALRVADAVPRLAVGADGWRVTRADQFAPDAGELTFGDGRSTIQLMWRPAGEYATFLRGRLHDSDPLPDVDVAGSPARLFVFRGSDWSFEALWRHGDHLVVLRSGGLTDERLTRRQFTEVVSSLRLVGVDAWLEAMPASVVQPGSVEGTVEEMLEGIPLPPGFDRTALPGGNGSVRDRYQLGARVVSPVACGWIHQWLAARQAGDAVAAQQAVDAMATSRSWPVLLEMQGEGAFPGVLWDYADAIATDGAVLGSREPNVRETVDEAFGC